MFCRPCRGLPGPGANPNPTAHARGLKSFGPPGLERQEAVSNQPSSLELPLRPDQSVPFRKNVKPIFRRERARVQWCRKTRRKVLSFAPLECGGLAPPCLRPFASAGWAAGSPAIGVRPVGWRPVFGLVPRANSRAEGGSRLPHSKIASRYGMEMTTR